MTRNVVVTALAVAAMACTAGWVRAQESLLAELYGQGVHAYFANDYGRAHDWLAKAIAQGSRDPRCYYFRGLCYRRLGRPDEARMDFEKGAQLEATSQARIYPVGRSLQRVQGPSRIALETHRREARLALRLKNMKAAQARYESVKRADREVVRDRENPPKLDASELVQDPARVDPADPFTGPDEAPSPAPKRAEPTVIATDATSPAGDDKPAASAPPSPGATPAADVFGGGAGASGDADPFGGGTTAAPAAGSSTPSADPFGGGGGDDPFGGASSSPPAAGGSGTSTPPAPAPAMDDADDPFGDSSADPFGGGDSSAPAAGGAGTTPPEPGLSGDSTPSNPFVDDEPGEKPAEDKNAPAADPFGT